MTTRITRLLAGVAAAAAIAAPTGVATAQTIPGRYIVVLNQGVNDPRGFAAAQGIAPHHVYSHALRGFAADLPVQALKALENNPHVAWIEPDSVVRVNAQTIPTGVDRVEVDQVLDGTMMDVDIAIIDTGIDMTHSDLNVVGGIDCVRPSRKTGACKAGGNDDNGHGTHAAGSAAALDDGNGVVGVAPGARLYAVKVLDSSGSGSRSGVIAGIDWVTANAGVIDVASMSLGGGGSDDTDGMSCSLSTDAEHIAICSAVAAGVTFVVAAGNELDDAANHVPAAYDEVITVSALADFDGKSGGLLAGTFAFSACTESEDDSFACFSNYGHDVDIMAPGVGILSTLLGGGYGTMSGTSMACPHVTGAAARILAAHPDYAPEDVKAALLANADPAPCATPSGVCADDPDGVQEPLLMAGPPAPPCASDAECEDGNPCTVDTCDGQSGACAYATIADDTPCGGGVCCGGACSVPVCGADADCLGAGDACTTDVCLFGGTCAATCEISWAACGVSDGCCGPTCTSGNDGDCQAGPTSVHVADVAASLSLIKGKYSYQVSARAQIVDSEGAPVSGATVTLSIGSPSGSAYPSTVVTDAQGYTSWSSLKSGYTGTYTATVTAVTAPALPYAAADDAESCQGLLVPNGAEVPCP